MAASARQVTTTTDGAVDLHTRVAAESTLSTWLYPSVRSRLMKIVDWEGAPKESWRAGTETRLHASAVSGSERLCVGEQWFDPGSGTPEARHAPEVEEVISVLQGAARVRVNDETQIVRAGQSVIIPGGATHQLTAIENVRLHVWFVLSAAAPAVFLVAEPGETFTIGGSSSEPGPS